MAKAPKTPKGADAGTTYLVVIGGQYFCQVDGKSEGRHYEVTVKMNQRMVDNNPLSAWKKTIAPKLMPKLYPGFVSVWTHEVLRAECPDNPHLVMKQLPLMNREDLISYIATNELPVNSHLYDDLGELRQAIRECEEDEEVFVKNQEHIHIRKKDKVSLENEFVDLGGIDAQVALNKTKVKDGRPTSKIDTSALDGV